MTISTSSESLAHPRATVVTVDAAFVRVTVQDGRQINVPVAWFPWLANATDSERQDFTVIGGGAGIWWEELDEGLAVPPLFGLPEDL